MTSKTRLKMMGLSRADSVQVAGGSLPQARNTGKLADTNTGKMNRYNHR